MNVALFDAPAVPVRRPRPAKRKVFLAGGAWMLTVNLLISACKALFPSTASWLDTASFYYALPAHVVTTPFGGGHDLSFLLITLPAYYLWCCAQAYVALLIWQERRPPRS